MRKTEDFVKGQSVVVKPQVRDPDFNVDIGGWQGRIVGVRKNVVTIAWDSVTLESMPDSTLTRCEQEGLDWTQMDLDITEVAPTPPRDRPEAVQATTRRLQREHQFDHLGEEAAEIKTVLGNVDEKGEWAAFEAWDTHLGKVLVFPFEAEISEYQEHGPLREGDRLTAWARVDVDDLRGIIVAVRKDHRKYALPLCDLRPVDRGSSNYRHVTAYAVWFANH
jgi:hypothetical protein